MTGRRRILGGSAALAASLLLLSSAGRAADPVWLKLQAPRFGVVSQLDENATRRWAIEFDQFVDALHQLYQVDELALSPLTIVLFEDPRAFAPYRTQTASGQANVAGFFANMDAWSVIGLSSRNSTAETRHVVHHEAVHWFLSGERVESPLWFEEGIAEVFSTFEVKNGRGRWGLPIQEDVDYLRATGVQSLDDFLRTTQDQALHGSGKYYPEAWAFVHYLTFGNNGAGQPTLRKFLELQRETDLDSAFNAAFGLSYKDATVELRNYLARGKYGIAELDVRDRGAEMSAGPASPLQVEFALARLAAAGGNDDLARRHLDAVVAAAPRAAPAYELLALLAGRAGDAAAARAALDQAIELGSTDANVYRARARQLLDENRKADTRIDESVPPDAARSAADMFEQSLALRPRNRDAYEGLLHALLNVDAVTERDDATLAVGRRALPTEGMIVVAQAAVAKQGGDVPTAARLLRAARKEPLTLPPRYRTTVTALHDSWLIGWLSSQLDALIPAERFDDAQALIEAQLADDSIDGRPRTVLESMRLDVDGFRRIAAAAAAGQAGNRGAAETLLREFAADPGASPRAKRAAERLLERVAGRAPPQPR
ncbi:MAG TPA: hypothetical protein VE907_16540 [Gammaproteobacteria bacterium]|nr:hypothetical protein [Gammaproteobacteria bacterium]